MIEVELEVKADLSDDNKWIIVRFDYDAELVGRVKNIAGARFVGRDNGGPYWKVPADMETARDLRGAFGKMLKLSDRLKAWGKATGGRAAELMSLASAADATLERVPTVLPLLYNFIGGRDVTDLLGDHHISPTPEGRPYQRADIAFHAKGKRTGNFNQPGTGKTFVSMAAPFEAGTDAGPNLVVAPVTSIDVVWEDTLLRWQPHPVYACIGSRPEREWAIKQAQIHYENDEPFWLVVNPAMLTYSQETLLCDHHFERKNSQYREDHPRASEIKRCTQCATTFASPYPQLQEWEWANLIVDEFHKCGLGNPATLTSQALKDLTVAELIIDISGTPMQGKPIKLFSVLQHLRPDIFTSKWKFAAQWLDIEDNGYGKVIHGIRRDREEAFAEMLSQFFVRRTKEEVLKWLPPKQHQRLWIPMIKPKQQDQYDKFAADAEVTIEEEQLGAVGILAEYTRLRQFANAYCRIEGYDADGRPIVMPTEESNKLPVLLELLEERGISKDTEMAGGDEQVVIFSQFTRMVDMVVNWLRKQGISAEAMTGNTTAKERARLVREFQGEGGCRVLVMNTMVGGVSVTLDRASTVIFLDETWVPDDQEQAEDRVHRGSRNHQVMIYYLHSKDSIESLVQDSTGVKAVTNTNILDAHRAGWRATRKDS